MSREPYCEICHSPECSPHKLKLELSGASFSTMTRRMRICFGCIEELFFANDEEHDMEVH